MLKKMMYKKIAVASSLLVVMAMLYLIPLNNQDIKPKETLEYVYPNDLATIYLLDEFNNLSRTKISASNLDNLSKSKDLIELLVVNGKKKDILPNGFKPLLPENTKVLNIELDNGILTINFSSEFNNIKKEYEEKLIESLVYTLTSIDGIDKISLEVDGNKLLNLPNSKKKLPQLLDKSYGINKQYDMTSLSDIDSYTVYYVLNYNDSVYYTPVTKYVNNENQDKVKVIIDELATSYSYQSNLMSYLDSNAKLLNYEITDKTIKLNFNDSILSDITSNLILEEVIYTISLSLYDYMDVSEVVFLVNNQEISTISTKMLD